MQGYLTEEDEEDTDINGLDALLVEKDVDTVPSLPKWKRRLRDYREMIQSILGIRFVMFLIASQFLGKGILQKILRGMILPLFKPMVDAATLQLYTVVIVMPWAVKPLMGLASDLILIGGYNKRYWLVIGCSVGISSAGLLFLAYHLQSPLMLVFCLMGINAQVALYDLLSEGKYAEIRNANPKIGSDATTLVQGMNTAGALIATTFVGILADLNLFWILFIQALVLTVIPLVPTLLGWLPESRLVNASCIQIATGNQDAKIIWVVLFCGVSSIAAALLAALVTPLGGLVLSVVLLICSLVGCWLAFPAAILQVALYQVLTALAWPSMGSALDYFYTANPVCLPGGPNFDYSYYITYTGLVGTAISLVGVGLYQVLLSRLRFRPVLFLTTFFVILGGLSDLVLTMRWNLAWGISDKTAYMLGEAVLEPLLDMLNWIPASALIAMAVPKGMESSCFAFMAGISNFARMASDLSGSVIYTAAGIVTTDEACNFDALPALLIACHIVLPIMISVPAVFLIPNLEQTDSLTATH